MAAHVHLKNEFTEDKKCHILMRWLIYDGNQTLAYSVQKGVFFNSTSVCNINLTLHTDYIGFSNQDLFVFRQDTTPKKPTQYCCKHKQSN